MIYCNLCVMLLYVYVYTAVYTKNCLWGQS